MRLLASTDYALRVLMLLAEQPPGVHLSVEALAQRLGGLSRHHLHKIVQDLTAAGATRTVRGAGGGVLLAQLPGSIRLGDLIRRLEAGQAMVECFKPADVACTLTAGCRLRGILWGAQQDFFAHLDGHTLADCLPAAA